MIYSLRIIPIKGNTIDQSILCSYVSSTPMKSTWICLPFDLSHFSSLQDQTRTHNRHRWQWETFCKDTITQLTSATRSKSSFSRNKDDLFVIYSVHSITFTLKFVCLQISQHVKWNSYKSQIILPWVSHSVVRSTTQGTHIWPDAGGLAAASVIWIRYKSQFIKPT